MVLSAGIHVGVGKKIGADKAEQAYWIHDISMPFVSNNQMSMYQWQPLEIGIQRLRKRDFF
jgi:hypothetical protein